MRRDYFTLDVRNVDGSAEDGGAVPTLHVSFEGPADELLGRLADEGDQLLDAGDVDVAYRLQTAGDAEPTRDQPRIAAEEAEGSGVVALANRVTGEFILEVNVDVEDVLSFVRAARAYGTESGNSARYRIELAVSDDHVATYDKSTFLIYDEDGDLLREHSLIPNNVEL